MEDKVKLTCGLKRIVLLYNSVRSCKDISFLILARAHAAFDAPLNSSVKVSPLNFI